MRNLGVLVLIFSLIMAGVLAYGVYGYLNQSDEPVAEVVKTTEMPFALADIPEDTLIDDKMIEMKEVPDGDYSIYYRSKEDIIGKYTVAPILTGEMFHTQKVVEDNSNRLVAKFDPNYRAVSFMVTEYSAVADLIKPGNRVDVYVYLPELTENQIIIRPAISKLVTQNAEILAISQEMTIDHEPRLEVPSTYSVTMALYYTEVERLLLAENIGYLKLALRSFEDNEINSTNGVIWEELLLDDNNYLRDLFPEYQSESEAVIEEESMDSDDNSSTDNESNDLNGDDNTESSSENINAEVPTTSDDQFFYYTVKYGDTLMKIAREFYDDDHWKYTKIKEANNIGDNNIIVSGQVLKIPKQ